MNPLYGKIRIVHLPSYEEPFVILDKPRGLPSAPLFEGDISALTFAIGKFPEISKVKGRKKIEYGLVHRIDTETKGLLLICTEQSFYDKIMSEQTNGRFFKTYKAQCDSFASGEGFPILDGNLEDVVNCINKSTNESSCSVIVRSRFRPFGLKNSQVRPVNESAGKAALKKAGQKEYETQIKLKKSRDGIFARCRIKEGYRHQVRCHLAWLGFPIKGDPLYNSSNKKGQEFKFDAIGLEFLGYSFNIDNL